MTDTTAPRCPTCGERLNEIGVNLWVCINGHGIMGEPYRGVEPPPRVPCPLCAGTGDRVGGEQSFVEQLKYSGLTYLAMCPICRGRGDVPPELARLWSADAPQSSGSGQRSGGEG